HGPPGRRPAGGAGAVAAPGVAAVLTRGPHPGDAGGLGGPHRAVRGGVGAADGRRHPGPRRGGRTQPRAGGLTHHNGSRMCFTRGSVARNSCTAGSRNAATRFLMLSVSAHLLPMVSTAANSSGGGGAKICRSSGTFAAM